MKTIYEDSVFDKIRQISRRAEEAGKNVKRIELSKEEMKELADEMITPFWFSKGAIGEPLCYKGKVVEVLNIKIVEVE